jgi:hypothetical protein
MNCSPPRALYVPAGTAAAVVTSPVRQEDPLLESRRWTHLSALAPARRIEALRALVAEGVYARVERRILVVRIVRDGTRALACIVELEPRASEAPLDASSAEGLAVEARLAIESDDLAQALIAATRTRPIFHGTTADGTTLSGFDPEDQDAILDALAAAAPTEVPAFGPPFGAASRGSGSARLLAVFAGGQDAETFAIPAGLVVAG